MENKSKKIKKVIIILVIICILLGVVIKIVSMNENELDEIDVIDVSYSIELNKVQQVQSKSDYYLTKECIEKFYNYYLTNKDVYSLLDNEYIEEFDIKKEDINGKFGNFEKIIIDITKMYFIESGIGIKTYFAYGYLIDTKTNNITDLSIGVKIDTGTSTFSILPYEYLEKNGCLELNENSKTKFKEETEIVNKTNNTFKYTYVNDQSYIDYLLKNYINRSLYNTELMYKCLDEEYRQKRFGNLQKFEEFIEENKERYNSYDLQKLKNYDEFESMDEYMIYMGRVNNMEITSYQKTKGDNYTQYMCIDNYNNYYIFRETAPMEYTIYLDTYTIDLPEFLEKYRAATTEEKVAYNIQKIVEALNTKDYNYIYSKLADEFKVNYFKTYEDFEKYAKTTFGIGYEVTFNRYTETQSFSTYEITLTRRKSSKTLTKTIVMRLEEGTDFVMSFNVN